MKEKSENKSLKAAELSYRNGKSSALISVLILFLEKIAFFGGRSLLFLFLLEQTRMREVEIYTLYALFGTGMILAPMLSGWICDVFLDKRLSMLVGNVLAGIGVLLVCTGEGLLIVTGLGFWAMGSGAIRPAQLAYFGEMASSWGRNRLGSFYTLMYAAVTLGSFLAPVAFGVFTGVASYTVGFILVGLVYFANAGITAVGMEMGIMEKEHGEDIESGNTIPAVPGSNRWGLAALFGLLLVMVPIMGTGLYTRFGEVVLEMISPLFFLLFGGIVLAALILTLHKFLGTLTAAWTMVFSILYWLAFELAESFWPSMLEIVSTEFNLLPAYTQSILAITSLASCLLIGGVGLWVSIRKPALVGGIRVMAGFIVGAGGFWLMTLAEYSPHIGTLVFCGMVMIALAETLIIPQVMALVVQTAGRRARTMLMGALVGGVNIIATSIGNFILQEGLLMNPSDDLFDLPNTTGIVVKIRLVGVGLAAGSLFLFKLHEQRS